MKWVAFFSQTGSEIVEISKRLGQWPDIVVTNNKKKSTINKELLNHYQFRNSNARGTEILNTHNSIITIGKNITSKHYRNIFNQIDSNFLITLNGWLKIVPGDICKDYLIYNGHPGLITRYPELKGKDPQERAWDGKYELIGSVVHVATEGVDEGPVLMARELANQCQTKDELYERLHDNSIKLWEMFLRERLIDFTWQDMLKLSIVGMMPYYYKHGEKFFNEADIDDFSESLKFLEGIHPFELFKFTLGKNFKG